MSRQTPHRCLQVHEILDNIFSNILGEQDLPEHERSWPLHESRTLLSLAVTCKTFTEPALDRLWYHLADLKPLGYCLPKQSSSASNSSSRFFERLHYYLEKVRVYGAYSGNVAPPKTHHLFIPALLRNQQQDGPLFPNLKRLHIYLDQFQDFAWLPQALIGPGLQLLNLVSYRQELYKSSFFRQSSTWQNLNVITARIGKFLKHLKISTDQQGCNSFLFPPHTPIASSLSALSGLESLRIVQVYLSANLLSHLISNPSLHTLEFTISNLEASRFFSDSHMPASILQTVTLRMWDLELGCQLLSRLCPAGLRQLRVIQLDNYNDSWNFHRFLTSPFMSSGGCVKDLQELEVLRKCTAASPEGPAEIVSDTLLPILHIPKLQVLRLSLCGRVDLSSEMLERVANACPHPRVFDLHESTNNHIPELTLLDIISFACKCKFLKDLRIRFDARRGDYELADLDKLTRGGPCQNLRILDVCLSPISRQKELISQLLFVSFPSLEHLLFGEIHSQAHQDFMEPSNDEEPVTHVAWKMIAEDFSKYGEGGLRGLMNI